MKILFITNLVPYPLDNGGKVKSYNTLSMLSEGNEIDIFSFYESEKELSSISFMKKKFNDVFAIEKALTTNKNLKKMILIAIKSIFNKYPFVILKYNDSRMKQLLEEQIKRKKYDLVYIDHLQLGIYYDVLRKLNVPIYLDEHNCEHQILKRKLYDEKSILKKVFLNLEYKKLKKFEESMIRNVDKVIVLSEEDKKLLSVGIQKDKFITIPIPINIDFKKELGSRIEEEIKIIFLGTLTWYPNIQGIDWFVDKVIPKLELNNIKYKLYIVGKDPSEELIKKCKNNNKIIITGYVESVDEYIEKCDIMVVPIFVGSGMRVKILEGLGKRIPIISTSIGAEGINIENEKSILLAENEEDFIDAIIKLKDDDLYLKLQKNGNDVFDSLYSIDSIRSTYRNSVLNKGGELYIYDR